jgi:hypothetical protein
MWSEGAVPEPSEGTPQYEISLYGKFPEERLMYVFIFQYDQTAKKGYVYLPGKGEKWYETYVRSIYRGVEGHWFNASEELGNMVEPLIRKAKSAAER